MKMLTNDIIVADIRSARDKHASRFAYDIKNIFQDIRAKQQSSGRKYIRYPARPKV